MSGSQALILLKTPHHSLKLEHASSSSLSSSCAMHLRKKTCHFMHFVLLVFLIFFLKGKPTVRLNINLMWDC